MTRPGAGFVFVFIAAVIGSCLAFLISRYLARKTIEKKLQGNQKFFSIDRAIGEQGLKIVFLLRLSPAFPFNLLNYALGLTKIRFQDYVIASFGMLPGTILYVYYGKIVGDVAQLASDTALEKGRAYYIVLILGLLATILVTALVTKIAKKVLKEATDGATQP